MSILTLQGLPSEVTAQVYGSGEPPTASNSNGTPTIAGSDAHHSGTAQAIMTAAVSGRAKLLATLAALEKTNLPKAKEMLRGLSDSLRGEAASANGEKAASLLEQADTYAHAAETGDLSKVLRSAPAIASAAPKSAAMRSVQAYARMNAARVAR